MKQMYIDPYKRIMGYSPTSRTPQSFQILKPVLFKQVDVYCCLFGPDLEDGILGCGDSPHEAVLDWDTQLQERIGSVREGDEVAEFIIRSLS